MRGSLVSSSSNSDQYILLESLYRSRIWLIECASLPSHAWIDDLALELQQTEAWSEGEKYQRFCSPNQRAMTVQMRGVELLPCY